MSAPAEETLLTVRTHPKVLTGPILMQLLLIVVHVLLALFLPRDTGIGWFDIGAPFVLHGGVVVLELVFAVLPIMRWWHSTYTVTSFRVIKSWGILYKNSREIPLDRIVSVSTEKGILDRIFRCGTLVFYDSAQAGELPPENPLTEQAGGSDNVTGIRFHDVPRVEHVRQIVDSVRFGDR